jgi:hypothetical protein
MKNQCKSLSIKVLAHFCTMIIFFAVMSEISFGQNSKSLSFSSCQNYSDSCIYIGNMFIKELTEKKFDNLADLFSENILFRALIPSSLVTSNNPHETASIIKNWFYVDDSEKYEILDSRVEVLVDCLHIYYKIFETYKGSPYNVEQHLYCEVTGGKIEKLSLLCSGFREVKE